MGAVLGAAAAAYTAGIGYVVFRYLTTGTGGEQDLASLGRVKVEGAESDLETKGYKMFRFGSMPSILLKAPNGQLFAYSAVCTHLGCNVTYQRDNKRIYCACHGGVYDPLSGDNIAGPPPDPLKAFSVSVEEDGIYVEKA
jgi:cytochrome b6-f complex iron-sulfur subunit